jgi:hypothetical protein
VKSFLALALVINVAVTMIASRHPQLAVPAVLDMTVTVAALYYWLLVRPGLRPRKSLLFVALLGLLRASFAFPHVVPGREFILGVLELLVIGTLVRVFLSAGDDPVSGIQTSLAGIVPFGAAGRALAGELSVLYYAFAWRAKSHVPAGAQPFTMHKTSGIADLMLVIAPFSLLEIFPVHLLAAHWSRNLAWVLTGLSVYGALWIFALGRSFALRPGFVTESEILVRFGTAFSLRIPKECIESVQREPIADAMRVSRNGAPNVYIRFKQPLEAERMLGFKKFVSAIALSVDGPLPVFLPWPEILPDCVPALPEIPRP